MDEHQHFCYAKTNPTDLPIKLSVQYARPYKQTATTTYNLLLITYYLKIETPQSADADSSPKSGAKWLAFSFIFTYYKGFICRGDQWSSV